MQTFYSFESCVFHARGQFKLMCMDEGLNRLCAVHLFKCTYRHMVMHTQINLWKVSLWRDFTQDVLAGDKLSGNIFSLLIIFYPFINVIFLVKMVSKYLYIWLTKNY